VSYCYHLTPIYKSYIVLDDAFLIIQGDGVDKEAIKEILEALKEEGLSADNIAFGMGGGLYRPLEETTSDLP